MMTYTVLFALAIIGTVPGTIRAQAVLKVLQKFHPLRVRTYEFDSLIQTTANP